VTAQDTQAHEAAAPVRPSAAGPRAAWSRRLARVRPRWFTDDVLRGVRWGLIGVWVIAFARQCYLFGVPLYRSDLLVWMVALLIAASLGKRSLLSVVADFLPFAAVLVCYDYLRGLSDTFGMPTWWHPQVDVDRFLFFGHEPTVWLQEHLKRPSVQWYDIVVTLCYCSFFFLPYVTAGVMWLRSRRDFYRWGLRFVALSFIGFAFFALTPAAPPWAAARCSAADVANHPDNPSCMYFGDPRTGGLLGRFTTHQPGANPWLERISTRGLNDLHLHFANVVITAGQGSADQVAAVPSLHLGGTVLFCIFMWSRLNKRWRPLLVAYPVLMMFSLAYSGEHYVADGIAGALAAWFVHVVANRIERWRNDRRRPDTLESPAEPTQESPCPPTHPLPATTPSST
jgi:hypothetical protein